MAENKAFRDLGKYMGLAFLLPLCILIGYVMGHFLDRAFHTTFLTLVFLLFGIAAGFIELIRELSPDKRDSSGK